MIDWGLLAWPANAWLLCAFVAVLSVMSALRRRVRFFAWLGGRVSAVCSIACALVVTVALGLLPQNRSREGDWWQHLISSWPFVLAWAWLVLTLGLATIRVAFGRWRLRTVVFVLNHLGLLVALLAATLGSADMHRLRMAVGYEPQAVAWDEKGNTQLMDFSLELLDFTIDEEPTSGMPRKFTARVRIVGMRNGASSGRDCPSHEETIQVNSPAALQGWKIYLIGYEADLGEDTRYCEFELVRDPWLPWVYVGIAMMLAGAAGLFLLATTKKKKT